MLTDRNERYRLKVQCLQCHDVYNSNLVDHLDGICRCKTCGSTKLVKLRSWRVTRR